MADYSPAQIQKFYTEQWTKLEKEKDVRPGPPISYFNNNKIHSEVCIYDKLFHHEPGYDQSMHRSDRMNWRKIDEGIFKEERKKPISILTSFEYGRLTEALEFPGMYKRKVNVIADFYQNGRLTFKNDDVK